MLGHYNNPADRSYLNNPNLGREPAELNRALARNALRQGQTASAAAYVRQAQQEFPSIILTDEERASLESTP